MGSLNQCKKLSPNKSPEVIHYLAAFDGEEWQSLLLKKEWFGLLVHFFHWHIFLGLTNHSWVYVFSMCLGGSQYKMDV